MSNMMKNYTKKLQALTQGVHPTIYCSVVLFLVSYVTVDIIAHISEYDVTGVCSSLSSDALKLQQGKFTGDEAKALEMKWNEREGKYCDVLLGHLPSKAKPTILPKQRDDPWKHMKWVGKPARCRVKGQLIEALDDSYNFRRGFALKYVDDVEDKFHLLPWVLGNKVNLNFRKRRVYLDLGANRFDTSVQWFMRMYPCDFTEVHAFENSTELFRFPEFPYDETNNTAASNEVQGSRFVGKTPGIPKWMIQRMKIYNKLVSDGDDDSQNALNITRFIKETLGLTPADTVVVKMDIEGSEWPILTRWMADPEMAEIIDELFVEIHYSDPSMNNFGWYNFGEHTREDATHLLAGLRSKGYFVHPWP